MNLWVCALLACLALPVRVSATDLTLHQRIIGGPDGKSHEMTQYWTDDKTITDDAHTRTIADLNLKTLTIVSKERKTYSVMSFDDMRRQAEELQKRLPPEAQKMMNEQAQITLTPTGKTETIAGYPAKEYAIGGGPFKGSMWITEALDLGTAGQQLEKLSGLMGHGPMRPGGQLAEEVAKLKGVPLRTSITTLGPQRLTMTTEVTSVSKHAPPADVLKVPSGYKQVAPPAMSHATAPPA